MAEKRYTWTVDVEGDWGGRTNTYLGLDKGLPIIYRTFRKHNVKALFFISTELLQECPAIASEIVKEGHEIGCHGHFHFTFQEPWRQHQNMSISKTILENYCEQSRFEYRAPKFSYTFYGHQYSDPLNHVSILRHMWYRHRVTSNSVFYIHPFDLVGGKNAPTLFCKWWYSKPRKAYDTFTRLISEHPGNMCLETSS